MIHEKKRNSQEMKESVQIDQVLSMDDNNNNTSSIKRQKYSVSSNDTQQQQQRLVSSDQTINSSDININNMPTTSTTNNQKSFLFCHFYMLRSLYCNNPTINNTSAFKFDFLQQHNENNDDDDDDKVNDNIWKLIEQFLIKKTELEDTQSNAKYLNNVYEESKYVNFNADTSKIFSNKRHSTTITKNDDDAPTTPSTKNQQPQSNSNNNSNLFFQNPQYHSKFHPIMNGNNTPRSSLTTNPYYSNKNKGCWLFLTNILSKKSSISLHKAKESFLPYASLLSFVQILCCKLRAKYHKMNVDLKKKYGYNNNNLISIDSSSSNASENNKNGKKNVNAKSISNCKKEECYHHMSKVEELKIKISLWHLLHDALKLFQC